MIVQVRTIPAPMVVTVAGEVDLDTAPQLREQIFALPEENLVLDISGVRLLAAAGLRTLLEVQNRRARSGAQLVLVGPSTFVRRVLCVTGLEKALPITTSVDEAVAFLAGPAERTSSSGPRADADGHRPTIPPARRLPRSWRQRGQAEA